MNRTHKKLAAVVPLTLIVAMLAAGIASTAAAVPFSDDSHSLKP